MFWSGVNRGEQRLRAGIVVGIVERLHADLQQHLVALAARARDPAFQIDAVGRERIGHGGRKFRERLGGAVRADAEPLDHDRDARRVGAARLRLHGARIDLGRDARRRSAIFGIAPWREVSRGADRSGRRLRLRIRSLATVTFFFSRGSARLADRDFLTLAGRAVDDRDGLGAGLVAVGERGRRGRIGLAGRGGVRRPSWLAPKAACGR